MAVSVRIVRHSEKGTEIKNGKSACVTYLLLRHRDVFAEGASFALSMIL
jgi:hypothetical protein